MSQSGNFLIISDLQIPFEAQHALEFCVYLKKFFKIPDENVYNVGDEVDQYFGSLHKKSPDALHTPLGEIRETIEKIKLWADRFPRMKIAESNHGVRWQRKAFEADIPSILMRRYQEAIEAPEAWKWAKSWTIRTKNPFIVKHGVDLGGKTPYRLAAEIGSVSVAFGHLHSSAGLCHIKTVDKMIWAMNTGCLIDREAYAFQYNKDHRFQPTLGVGVVINEGSTPLFIPYET